MTRPCVTLRPLALALSGALLLALAAGPALANEAPTRTQVVRYVGTKKGRVMGKEVMLLVVALPGGNRTGELYVPNNDWKSSKYDPLKEVATAVEALEKGDYVELEIEDSQGNPVKSVMKYEPKPGEESPTGYIYLGAEDEQKGKTPLKKVTLKKWGQEAAVMLPTVKGEDGTSGPDPKLLAVVDALTEGDVVDAEIKTGRPATLLSIEPYKEPQTGTFTKLVDADVDGQKASAAELEAGGSKVTAVLPGKLVGKKWVTDGKVLAAVRKIKAGSDVEFRTRNEGDKVWLKSIRPASKMAGADSEKDEKKEKD